jgi:hypothetical protein
MNYAPTLEKRRLRRQATLIPLGPRARLVGKGRCLVPEPNHYAVVLLDAAGVELRGWDFKTLDVAMTFSDKLRLKHLSVEVWARDEFGTTLARRLPGAHNCEWFVIADTARNQMRPSET